MQTKELQKINDIREGILSKEQIKTLADASIIPHDTPGPILQVFAAACAAHGLSPYKREIYLVKYGSQYNTIVGIDGLRAKAARTGELPGRDDAQYDRTADGKFLTAYDATKNGLPTTCTVTVYRLISGQRHAFTKTVLWSEYCPANMGGKWKVMGYNMIEKCARSCRAAYGLCRRNSGLAYPGRARRVRGYHNPSRRNKPSACR
ncbi:MAG: recombinase RecT [Lewinellaceae bacterium]|nr:recombinase RecT [Lewinellaceae bacterium]